MYLKDDVFVVVPDKERRLERQAGRQAGRQGSPRLSVGGGGGDSCNLNEPKERQRDGCCREA